MTLPDLFAFNYRERVPVLRIISVVVILASMLLYVAAQFAAAGKAFAATFGGYFEHAAESLFNVSYAGLDYHVGVVAGALIVLLYTVSGGFRAVCWTDFLQALLMVGTLVIFPAYLLLSGNGGYDYIISQFKADPAESGLLSFIPPLKRQSVHRRTHRLPSRQRSARHKLRLSGPTARAGALHGP